MRLLIATTNPGKLREIRPILGDPALELASLADLPAVAAPEETGTTFAGNARLKARYYSLASGLVTVAEDSGLEIDRLDRAPGVESARFGGADTSYPEKFALLYELLASRASAEPGDQGEGGRQAEAAGPASTARFVCAVAVAEGDRVLFETSGTIEGEIAPAPRGSGGFGYDPIFYYPPFGCTLAEAGSRKAEVSHRGKAFRHLRSWLISQVLRSSPPP